jgi:hypothetical protein
MAFSITVSDKSVVGNKRVHYCTVVADAAAGSVATGLSVVDHIDITLKSAASGAYKVRKNVLESGTAAVGYIAFSGVASGDEFFAAVYGR